MGLFRENFGLMLPLRGMAHYDFNHQGAYGYEQAFAVMRQLRFTKQDAIQQYRRMVFNVIARYYRLDF